MNKQLLFNVLNRSLEGLFVTKTSQKQVSTDCDAMDYDVYIKFDISRFTIYDTVEKANFLLSLSSISNSFDFYLYETSDIDFSTVSDLSSLSASDKGFNDDYIDHITVPKNAETVSFDITNIINKNIVLKKNYIYFRIYHNKSKSFTIKSISNTNVTGTINRFREIGYDAYDLGLAGKVNVSLLNGMLKFDFPSFDSGNKIIPIELSFAYSYTLHSHLGLVGDYILTSFEYLITKTDDYIIIKDVTLRETIYHKLTPDEAYTYAGYTCATSETYYSYGLDNSYLTVTEGATYTLKIVNQNIIKTFNYDMENNKLYIQSIENTNGTVSDKITFVWTNNLLTSVRIYNGKTSQTKNIITFIYEDNLASLIEIVNKKLIISLTYKTSSEGYKTIKEFKVYNSTTFSLTSQTPYIDNLYTFSDNYGVYMLTSVYDRYNNISYSFSYPYTYSQSDVYLNVNRITENGGLEGFNTYTLGTKNMKVVNQYGDIKHYYLNEFGTPYLVTDKYNNYQATYYDTKYNGSINAKGSITSLNKNYITNGKFESLTSWQANSSIITNTFLPEIIGTNVYKFSGGEEETLIQDISIKGNPFDKWDISLWHKVSKSYNEVLKVIISFIYDDTKEENEYEINCIETDFECFSKTVEAKKSYEQIEVKIVYQGHNECLIGDVRLYKVINNNTYDVTEENSIEGLNINGVVTEMQYDDKGRAFRSISSIGEIKEIEYDERSNIKKVKDVLTKEQIEYNYDNDNNLTKTVYTSKDGKTIQTSSTYDSYYQKLSETDENGNVTSYNYNLNKVSKITSSQGVITNITYDEDKEKAIKQEIVNNDEVTGNIDYTYDENLLFMAHENDDKYIAYFYDDNKRIESIAMDGFNFYIVFGFKI